MDKQKVAVLGGGIQGVCVALALAKDPRYQVELIDKNGSLFQETSLINEGKIHLGFVYALDDSFQTAERMLHDGLSFAPIVEYLIGYKIKWDDISSDRFEYLISEQSLVCQESLLAYYHKINDRYQEFIKDDSLHYLGQRSDSLLPTIGAEGVHKFGGISGGIITAEKSVDTTELRRILLYAVNNQSAIFVKTGCYISHIQRQGGSFRLEGKTGDEKWSENYDIVINCLWSERLRLDKQMGMLPEFTWVFRRKYRMLAVLPSALNWLKSYTIVQGEFGDVVSYRSSPETYLSWYPACLQGWSHNRVPPEEWSTDSVDPDLIINESLEGLNRIFPGINMADVRNLASGVIFARGKSDISDAESELHTRFEQRIRSEDGYFSINTSKLTSAPVNALELLKVL